VRVNGTVVTRHDHALHPGDAVTLGDAAPPSSIPILFEDESVIAVDKPAGLLTVATDAEKSETAFRHVAARLPQRPCVVHRLDRETSGVLLFAKSIASRDELQHAWERVEKTYLAVVCGVPASAAGVIDIHLVETKSLKVRTAGPSESSAKHAVTRYRVLTTRGPLSLLEVTILTGRKHQIRVHLAGLGTPIMGDTLYGAALDPARRLGLHAHRLAFPHPVTGVRVEVESPLPAPLARIV
jgi:23S rRNA pseudouridine1911/1915/1917 synthase